MIRLTMLFLCCLPVVIFAQQKVEFGVIGGFANYQGDLVQDPIELSETKISYGGFLRYHLTDKLKIRGNFNYGFISGKDTNNSSGLQSRGWSFKSNILEASLAGEFHPLGRSRAGETGIFERQVSPYVGLGLGIATFTPEVTVTDPLDKSLFPEQGEKTVSASIPVLFGVRADLLEFFSLGIDIGWRATFNDYLDGVSKNGNRKRNDWYLMAGLTASFFFGNNQPDYNFSPN